jgi:hypothetical protein
MQIRSISVKYERQFGLPGYDNKVLIGEFITGDLEEGDDPDRCEDELFARAKAQVKAEALPLMQKLIDERLEIIANLPPEYRTEFLQRLQERLGSNAH